MIKVEHTNKTFSGKYGEVHALQDVSIHVEKGDIYGIIGFSGAGKSTLLRLVNGLETPDSGTVMVHDQDLGSLKKAEETLSYIKAFPEELLSYLGRESAAGYLDWILPAAASYQDKYQIRLMRAAELVQEELETQIKDDWNRSACMEKSCAGR